MSRRTRFFRWYRTLPLLAVAMVGLLALAATVAPKALLRRFLYPVRYRDAIVASCARHGVEPALACAVIKCESDWRPDAVSKAGAVGLMQLMPDTASTVSNMGLVDGGYVAENLTDPATNIEFGCAYLGYLQQNLNSRDEVIAAYNAGIGTVQSWLSQIVGDSAASTVVDVIGYQETRLYLRRVNSAYERYGQLYDADLNPR